MARAGILVHGSCLCPTVDLVADIADLKHLERIVTGVRKIPGLRDMQRLQKI